MDQAPTIAGIVESVLYTDDLPRAVRFFREILGLVPMTGDEARYQSFQVGAGQVLLLFKRGSTLEPTPVTGGVIPPHDGTGPHHLGFAVAAADLAAWRARLESGGIAIEGEAAWERGGHSLFFRDPDGHLLELVTPGIWPNY